MTSELCLKTLWLSDLEGKFNNGFYWLMRYRFGEMIIEGPGQIREPQERVEHLTLRSASI